MKNILLIGDLRTAFNYGAIATSQSLINLINKRVDQEHFRTIEFRSFYHETPAQGWKDIGITNNSPLKSIAKACLRKIGLLDRVKAFRSKSTNHESYHVPIRYADFESFSNAVLNGSRLPYEKNMLEWADIVLINSEGNIVNGTDKNGVYRAGGLYVLFMAYFSKVVMGKPCYIINHTVDPANRDVQEMIKQIYPLMDGIYVREKLSFELLKNWGIENHRYVPDALFTYDFNDNNEEADFRAKWKNKIDFNKPYICLGDSSGIKNRYNHVKWDVVKTYDRLINELRKNVCQQIVFIDGYNGSNDDIQRVINKNGLVQVNLNNCSFQELYSVLKHSKIFISGRWHASIISLKAHTPILCFGSDSHKTEALYHEIDWPFYFFDTKSIPINVERICKVAKDILKYDCTDVWAMVDRLAVMAEKNVDMLD